MRLDHGGLLVSDVERAVRFYAEALGLEQHAAPADVRHARRVAAGGRHHQIHLIGETESGGAGTMTPRL